MSTSSLIEQERKKIKKEWDSMPEPKPTWEEYKRQNQRRTSK